LANLQSRLLGPVLRAVTRRHAALYRRFGGRRFGSYAGKPVLVLTTTGRRSGKSRSNPVVYMADGDRWLITGTNAGRDRPPAWWINLQARPEAEIQVGEERCAVTARTCGGDERRDLWEKMVAYNPEWGDYTRITRREIPVVVLERN
jgi:F420H(2)-dependent quinone reductase